MLPSRRQDIFDMCPQQPIVDNSAPLKTQISVEENFQIYQPLPEQEKVAHQQNHRNNFRLTKYRNAKREHRINRFRVDGYKNEFQKTEHLNELKILSTKLKNCKSLSQTKKNRNTPLIFPTYFYKGQKAAQKVDLKEFRKKRLSKIQTAHILPSHLKERGVESSSPYYGEGKDYSKTSDERFLNPEEYANNHRVQKRVTFKSNNPEKYRFDSVRKKANSRLNQRQSEEYAMKHLNHFRNPEKTVFYQWMCRKMNRDERHQQNELPLYDERSDEKANSLPSLTTKDLMKYIVEKRLHKDQDFRILRSRMVHEYGEKEVFHIWSFVMQYFGNH